MDQKTIKDAAVLEAAQAHLLIDTLETRGLDSLDFHDCSVWGIKDALEKAYEAGRRAGGA